MSYIMNPAIIAHVNNTNAVKDALAEALVGPEVWFVISAVIHPAEGQFRKGITLEIRVENGTGFTRSLYFRKVVNDRRKLAWTRVKI